MRHLPVTLALTCAILAGAGLAFAQTAPEAAPDTAPVPVVPAPTPAPAAAPAAAPEAIPTAMPVPNPMRALIRETALTSPNDPMAALRAPPKAEGDGPAPNPEFGGLPDGPGAEATFYQCVACHSTEIIKQQRVTDARWDDLWTWMAEQQGMVEPDPETRDIILGYLKTHFSSER